MPASTPTRVLLKLGCAPLLLSKFIGGIRNAKIARLASPEANAELPAWVKPQLTRLVTEAPSGDKWGHELKFDGYRMHVRSIAAICGC